MIYHSGWQFDGKHEEDDLLLLPTIAIGYSEHNEPNKNLHLRGIGVGLKWGYWAVFYSIYWRKKPNNEFQRDNASRCG